MQSCFPDLSFSVGMPGEMPSSVSRSGSLACSPKGRVSFYMPGGCVGHGAVTSAGCRLEKAAGAQVRIVPLPCVTFGHLWCVSGPSSQACAHRAKQCVPPHPPPLGLIEQVLAGCCLPRLCSVGRWSTCWPDPCLVAASSLFQGLDVHCLIGWQTWCGGVAGLASGLEEPWPLGLQCHSLFEPKNQQ